MPSFLADENFHGDIVRGLRRRDPGLDIIRIQDLGLSGASDPVILEEAAQTSRVLLTHDVATITKFAYDRLAASLPLPGVLEVRRDNQPHPGNSVCAGCRSRALYLGRGRMTTAVAVTDDDVVQAVRSSLRDRHPGGVILDVIDNDIRLIDDW